MATDSTLEMHRTHLRWHTDGDMWRNDMATWKAARSAIEIGIKP